MINIFKKTDNKSCFNSVLPKTALYHRDIKWNVSGLFTQDDGILNFIDMVKNGFKEDCPITSVHGCPPVMWNSGRITRPLLKPEIDGIIDRYTKIGMPLYLTFSNHLLTKEMLNDKLSNYLLDKIAETGQGGVILASDILSDYIRNKHPKMKLIASIIRAAIDRGAEPALTLDYYEKQAKKFDCVVFLPDDVFNYEMLKKIKHKDKFEIITNEPCLYGCKMRRIHYGFLASFYKNDIELTEKSFHFETNKCISKPLLKQIALHIGQSNSARTRNCNVTADEFDYLYDIGYRRFKLQGRNESPASFIYDLTKYILEPTYFAPLAYKALV